MSGNRTQYIEKRKKKDEIPLEYDSDYYKYETRYDYLQEANIQEKDLWYNSFTMEE